MKKFEFDVSVTTFRAAEILEIKIPRLREWISRGYIQPAHPATGRGTKARLDIVNLYQLKLFDTLLFRGFSRERAAFAIKALRTPELDDWTLADPPLFMSVWESTTGHLGESVFSSREYHLDVQSILYCFIINLGEIIDEIRDYFIR